ncbi:MAG: ribbon-helix-helix protein, CopG family [Rhodospirillaceae bacterium]|jgi:predicted transcriptional regulator|nr:ribbon-helix-helix protein, CopG family [Rhodospirillaceae bacterium]MBT3887437.1 ribbon-helix-helix protein, CopG family [Rhodospirillaceae bacterium]MBT4119268.1 ribbon-helix-helix protein, CopG family [Rhodospirillaceae bacterium]MBT4670768.1 ribbon-helix-helix protein, CopG family [Rhodospirillaceae bacterium]MBT4721893.1 ribbon-helix-helix protein, CopG family [Rhodospirillaceae bacterium]
MTNSTSLSFRVSPEKVEELDHLAKSMDRKRSWLLERALDAYLAEQARQLADIEAGLADLDAGRTISHDKVAAWLKSWGTDNELDPPR